MIEMRAGRLRCELHPGLGGAIAGLWWGDEPVLRSMPAAQLSSAGSAAAWPLVPFSNRIGQASVVWQGTQQPLVRPSGDAPHAIRGVGWHRPWALLDADATSAMLAYEHRPDPAWPFAFDCSHTLRLSPSGLELTLALTNQSTEPAPASLGWQPCFVKRPGGQLRFKAGGHWQLGPGHLPVVREAVRGLEAATEALALDDCYDDWDGTVLLCDERMQVRLASTLTRLVVHADPAQPHLCLQPVSHVANAVHLYAAGASAFELGLSILPPGETLVAQMSLTVESER